MRYEAKMFLLYFPSDFKKLHNLSGNLSEIPGVGMRFLINPIQLLFSN